jgi:hypothetical protein
MDIKGLQDCAGKQACDSNQLKLISGFVDDSDWSDDQSRNDSASAVSVKNHCTQFNGLDSWHTA